MRQHLWLGNERDAVHPAQRSAIEDMVVDLRDARLAPAGRDVARVEEKRAGGVILPRDVARDLRDRNGLVPQRRVTHRWHPAAAHEAELALLKYDAAQDRKRVVKGQRVSIGVK